MLFVGGKISVLTPSVFMKWAGGYVGMSYGSSIEGHPLSRSIDVVYDSKYTKNDHYFVLVHEMTHSWDLAYPVNLTGKIPDVSEYDRNNFRGTEADYNRVFGTERVSAQSDLLSLYNKYKKILPHYFRDYAFSASTEFVAESFANYYYKFLNPKKYLNEKNSYEADEFPDDLKELWQKYICISNNNYNPTGC